MLHRSTSLSTPFRITIERRAISHLAFSVAHARITRNLMFVLLAAFVLSLCVTQARATVFNQNQRLVGGTSPTVVPWDWDFSNAGPPVPNPLPVGHPVSIVYGIQVPLGNPNPISVAITLPASFTQTAMRCIRYSSPPSPGVTFIPGCTLPNVTIAPFTQPNDKVIIVFDGYFNQAGTCSASFVPSGGALGTGSEPKGLSFDPKISNLPVDLQITKEVKAGGGSFGSSASISITPTAGTLTYKLRITNISTPDPTYHTTDVNLGRLLRINDTLSTPGTPQDVLLNITLQNFQCTKSGALVDCPALPASWPLPTLGASNSWSLPPITYPTTSNGFLPAGGWFEITFNAIISTSSSCSPNQNNKLKNTANFTYSNGTTTVSDVNPTNNTTGVTTANLGVASLPTICPPPLGIQITKTLVIAGNWSSPFTYKITVKNTNTTPLTGLALADFVINSVSGTAFTATPSNVVCTPSCSASPTLFTPLVNTSSQAFLFSANFNPLAPNAIQTVQYDVQYSAPCTSSSGATSITNLAWVTGPVSGTSAVVSNMPALPICPLQVTKTQTSGPPSFATYPVTFGYNVVFKNTSPTQPLKVRTVVDSIAQDSLAYGTMNIDYSYTCTASGVTGATPLVFTSPPSQMAYNNPVWAGTKLIDFSSATGITFNPLGTLTCSVSVTLKQPPANDSKCQGAGNSNFVNSAFMDMSFPYNTNLPQQPLFYAKVTRPLPKCVSIVVGKSVSPNVIAGAPMTFTLTVKNAGNDPTPTGIHLLDPLPTGFSLVNWTCTPSTACSGNTTLNPIDATLSPISGGGITTITVNAIAPSSPGAYCNTDNATFNPFPPLTFFEGNQPALTTASACLQVNPPQPSTPKVTKVFNPTVISLGQPVKVSFTITNALGTGPQTGFWFADALTSPPFTTSTLFSNTCGGTAIVGGHVVGLSNGTLPAGPSSCTITFLLAPPTKCGVFQNNKKNIKEFEGVHVSGVNANLTVRCEPVKGEITKVALDVPTNFAGSFNFNVSCTPLGGTAVTTVRTVVFSASDPLTVHKGGHMAKIKTISIGTLQPGTSCSLSEQPPAPPQGCVWLPPTFAPANATVTAGPNPTKITVFNRLSCNNEGGPLPNKGGPLPNKARPKP